MFLVLKRSQGFFFFYFLVVCASTSVSWSCTTGLVKHFPHDEAGCKPGGYPEGSLALSRVPWPTWTQSGCRTGMLRSPSVHLPACASSSVAVSYIFSDFWSVLFPEPGLPLPIKAWRQFLSWRARQLARVDGFFCRLNLPSSVWVNTLGFLSSVQKWTPIPKDAVSWVVWGQQV